MEYLSIGKMAEKLGVTEQTLRNWDKSGKLKPAYVSDSGYRYYSSEQLSKATGLFYIDNKSKVVIGYCRVSTRKQSENLERQIDCVKQYYIARGYQFRIISNIGSGINYNKPGLLKLIEKINKKEVDLIVVLYKDRLLRFGFELVKYFAELNNVKIEVLDKIDKNQDQELLEDLVQIITVFSCKIQGKRKSKTKKLLKEFSKKIILEENFDI